MTELELEFPNCPLCGSLYGEILYESRRFTPYKVRCCNDCGMNYLSPRLTEHAMLLLYQQDQYYFNQSQGYNDYAAQEVALRETFRRLLRNLSAITKIGGSLLEVGCGYGYLLDEAQQYFSYRVGTDFSAGAVQRAQKYADLIYQGGVHAVNELECFDCVIVIHVIEHVYRPYEFIEALLKRVRPGGHLIVAAPDMGSFWRKWMGTYWPSFKLPEHILYFDKKTLSYLLSKCGVQDLKYLPYSHAFSLPLIASKLGVKLPLYFNRFNLWMPATTIAFVGKKDG